MAVPAYHAEAIASSNVIDLAERRAMREPRDPQPPAAAGPGPIVQLDDYRDPIDVQLARVDASIARLDDIIARVDEIDRCVRRAA